MKKKKRVELFGEEIKLWKAEKELSKAENLTAEQLTESNERLLKAFKDLIDQSKLSTRISDRLIFGLDANYTELLEENKNLVEKISMIENSFWNKIFKSKKD
jgi:hypothetical protein